MSVENRYDAIGEEPGSVCALNATVRPPSDAFAVTVLTVGGPGTVVALLMHVPEFVESHVKRNMTPVGLNVGVTNVAVYKTESGMVSVERSMLPWASATRFDPPTTALPNTSVNDSVTDA